MSDQDLLARVCATNFGYLGLGNEVFEAHGATFIRNRQTARRHDANTVGLIRSAGANAIDALFERVETEFAGLGHRRFQVDPLTPPGVEACLVVNGYEPVEVGLLCLLLEGEPRATPRPVEIRQAVSVADWQAYRHLDELWWRESGTGYFGPYDPDLHDELLLNLRVKAPQVRSWLAVVDGEARAFLSCWPGTNGVGMVEDLFCHPDYRHRGLATALIARCVADARGRGAGPVLINADAKDTPKQMYATLGFRPLYVGRSYLKKLG